MRACHGLIRKSALALVVVAVFAVAGFFFGKVLPSSFLPDEDQGYMYIQMQLPEASSLEATSDAAREVEAVLKATPGVQVHQHRYGIQPPQPHPNQLQRVLLGDARAVGRRARHIEEQFQVIKAKLNLKLLTLPQGTVFAFSPPAISGVGTSGGFQFVLEDRAGKDPEFLVNNLNKFLEAAHKRPELGMVTTTYIPSTPQKFVYVDKEKVLKQGVKLSDVYDTLQAFMGGLFVNYFNDFGRAWQVRVEAEAPYRSNLDNAGQFYVRNSKGEMVPLSALTRFETRYGPEFKMRFNSILSRPDYR